MASLSLVATAAVSAAFVAALWFIHGWDARATLDYLIGNAGTVLTAAQMVVMCLLFATKHYLAGAILLITALLTVFGVMEVGLRWRTSRYYWPAG